MRTFKVVAAAAESCGELAWPGSKAVRQQQWEMVSLP